MNSRTIEQSESEHPSVGEISAFVTRIWKHALVDSNTRAHRAEAMVRLAGYLESKGLAPKDFATVPVGSIVWNTEPASEDYPGSDFDYLLLAGNAAVRKRVSMLSESSSSWPEDTDVRQYLSLDFTGDFRDTAGFAGVLFTPNDYIAGNPDLANRTRLHILDHVSKPENDYVWPLVVGATFDAGYKYWEQPSGLDFIRSGPKDRATRLRRILAQKAASIHRDPEDYSRAFLRTREAFFMPSLTTYRDALTRTNGAINLNPRYASKGIQ